MDFADLDHAFFEDLVIVPAKLSRQIAIGRHREGLSVVSMRAASRKERRLIDG